MVVAESVDDEVNWFAGVDGVDAELVDGVPLVHADIPGPVRGGILFRVGTADEPMPLRGLSHLVEHLAIHGLVSQGDHSNGTTGPTITGFATSGTEAHVVEFLNKVAAAFRRLPMDRLEAERAILRVEAQNRSASMDSGLLRHRFGMTGYARGAYLEFGVDSASADDVAAWARDWFTRGNAVAWITTGGVPGGLDLRLPDGGKRPYVSPPSQLSARPAWVEGHPGRALIDAVVPRTTAGVLFAELLTRTLFRRLRVEQGFSYAAGAHYEPLDADYARIVVAADAEPDATVDMVDALADVLLEFRAGRFDSTDVERAKEAMRQHRASTASGVERVLAAAVGSLLGGEPPHSARDGRELDAVTEADLHDVARVFWADAIWQTPVLPERATDLATVPASRDIPVTGSWYEFTESRERLVVADDGLSIVGPAHAVTIPFAECALVMHLPDGARSYFRNDGAYLVVEPTLIPDLGVDAQAAIDASVPPELIARRPARPAEEIPQPQGTPPPGTPRGLGAWALVASVLAILVGAFATFLAWIRQVSSGRPGSPIDPESVTIWWVVGIVLLVGGLLLLWPVIRRFRWRKQRGLA